MVFGVQLIVSLSYQFIPKNIDGSTPAGFARRRIVSIGCPNLSLMLKTPRTVPDTSVYEQE
jgi:hypothetical protein